MGGRPATGGALSANLCSGLLPSFEFGFSKV
jgi:hypothetical protein